MAEDGNHRNLGSGPIAIAIAVAILICAVPLAYRILQCEQFDSGFSLERWFSFKCERSVERNGAGTPEGAPGTAEASAGNRRSARGRSQESTALTGHVYYEEKGRRPTGVDGVYVLLGTSAAPPYGTIEQGTVLKTVSTSRVRAAPGGTENIIDEIGGGNCVKVLQPPSLPAQGLREADSGGWLMVQATPCGR